MAVPQPTFGPNGFIAPSEKDDVLPAVKDTIDGVLGGGVNMDDTTPQGQLAVSVSAMIGNVNDLFVEYTQQVDPAYADGRMQDAIGRIYFIEREGALPTVVTCTCGGLPGVVIPSGSLVAGVDGQLYASSGDATIGSGGTVDVSFFNLVPGPTPCPAGTITTIYKAISGWDTVTNAASGVIGRNTETRAEFEERRRLSVAANSQGSLPSVRGAVLSVAGVLDAFVTENVTQTTQVIKGFTLAPNSLYVAAVGGSDADVARALWTKKSPGCGYNGNTTVVVEDNNSGYNIPYPSYNVQFQRPTPVTVVFAVRLAASSSVPSDATTQVQNAIVSAFAGVDGGPRARIGDNLFASRYYAPIAALGAWAQIFTVKLGCSNSPAAVFVGSIASNVLTVTSVTSGIIGVGQAIIGDNVIPGTTITGGSGTSWTLSTVQTVASETMSSVVAASDEVFINIDESPVVAAGNVSVVIA